MMVAAISAPKPQVRGASCTTTARPVLRTDSTIVSQSTGEIVRRSMSSADMPDFSIALRHWMTGAPTTLKKYEGLGHYPYVEAPDTVIPDIVAFMNGEWDDELRVTQRVKVGG